MPTLFYKMPHESWNLCLFLIFKNYLIFDYAGLG